VTHLLAALLVGLTVAGARVHAHHSFAAAYFEDQSVTIEGELVQFLFRNPHSFVHVLVKEKDGAVVRYAIEWGGAGQLGSQGVGKDTLKIGDQVVITGSPGRNAEDHRVRLVTLRRPKDGFTWGERPGQVVD
jgi:hypothetical protein